MKYSEYKNSIGDTYKVWEREKSDGATDIWTSRIIYNYDGSIRYEEFRKNNCYIGYNKIGFWAFWNILDDKFRQEPNILKCLLRYS
jgi:hypothetical protein